MADLFIKNMVCRHCVQAVKACLDELGVEYENVGLGIARLRTVPDAGLLDRIRCALKDNGFEIIDDAESRVIERAKHIVMQHVREENGRPHNLSECIERKLAMNYDTVSRLFSSKEGRTLEKDHIAQKVERVKELLQHGEYTLSEIADMVDYSSVAHLSRQFKNVTGMTPTDYLKGMRERRAINEV